jgi:hypothetical protein
MDDKDRSSFLNAVGEMSEWFATGAFAYEHRRWPEKRPV